MEGDTRTRDGAQQPQQGTVQREALILYCLAAGWSWKRGGIPHASWEKLILLPTTSLESAGTQLCPVPEGLPWRQEAAKSSLPNPPNSAATSQPWHLSQDIKLCRREVPGRANKGNKGNKGVPTN